MITKIGLLLVPCIALNLLSPNQASGEETFIHDENQILPTTLRDKLNEVLSEHETLSGDHLHLWVSPKAKAQNPEDDAQEFLNQLEVQSGIRDHKLGVITFFQSDQTIALAVRYGLTGLLPAEHQSRMSNASHRAWKQGGLSAAISQTLLIALELQDSPLYTEGRALPLLKPFLPTDSIAPWDSKTWKNIWGIGAGLLALFSFLILTIDLNTTEKIYSSEGLVFFRPILITLRLLKVRPLKILGGTHGKW